MGHLRKDYTPEVVNSPKRPYNRCWIALRCFLIVLNRNHGARRRSMTAVLPRTDAVTRQHREPQALVELQGTEVIRTRPMAPGLAGILAAVCIWGTVPFVIIVASQELLPGELVVTRMLIAGVLAAAAMNPRRLLDVLRRNLGFFVTLSLLGIALPNLLYVYALRTTTPIPVLSFVSNSYPVWAIAMAVIFLRERPSAYHLAGVAVALVGLYLMAGLAPSNQRRIPPGILLALLASLGWASGSVVSKKLTAAVDTTSLVAGRHLLSGLLLCPVMLVEGTHLAQASIRTWCVMGILVIMSLLSYQFYYRGLARTSVSSASVIETFGSVVTWGIAAVLYRQGLNATQLAGACLILAGTLLVTIRGMRRGKETVGSVPGLLEQPTD